MTGTRRILVAGGAGFVGSAVVRRFVRSGDSITVVDGLCPRTGGREDNLAAVRDRIRFVHARVEEVADLAGLVGESDAVIDCMGWSAHHDGLRDPVYDEELNLRSHLHLIGRIPQGCRAVFVYLGTRGQYGNPAVESITEETPMVPQDAQGTSKLAAEHYYRIYGARGGFRVASLRLPNTFGEGQPTQDGDIGLVGGFIRTALSGGCIEVYGGTERVRHVAYVEDVAEAVHALVAACPEGFTPLNLAGIRLALGDLANQVVAAAGRGSVAVRPMPDEIRALDVGNARIDDTRLRALIGAPPSTDTGSALAATVRYFEARS